MDDLEPHPYRGRIAPTPTGYLHLGHAATFGLAWESAREFGGLLLYREEDLDPQRCRPEYAQAAIEDLHWLGLDWRETSEPQSRRRPHYLAAWERLRDAGVIYPSTVSRRELAEVRAPQEGAEDPLFPPELRPPPGTGRDSPTPAGANWRFRVPDGLEIAFHDLRKGLVRYTAGRDFGDFLVWRRDDVPAYELAVVVDDHAMGVNDVVRGEDLLLSTARQLLVYEALGIANEQLPAYFHTPLLRDAEGRRLAKRHDALALRELREQGVPPAALMDWIHAVYYALRTGEPPPLPDLGTADATFRW
jgi:glutamyl-tRNA synthetase